SPSTPTNSCPSCVCGSTTDTPTQSGHGASASGPGARAARDRPAARGGVPPLRLRLPRVRTGVAEASPLSPYGCRRARVAHRASVAAPPRSAGDGTAARRPLDQRHRDVPRPVVLPRLQGEGRPRSAHISVYPHLVRGLCVRRGGLLTRDPPPRG